MADIARESVVASDNDDQKYSLKDLHTYFGSVIGILLAVVGIKYQGPTGTTLFRQNSLTMGVFVADVCIYAVALVTAHLRITNNDHDRTLRVVFVVSGATACELLLLVSADSKPFSWLAVNAVAFLFVEALRRIDFVGLSGSVAGCCTNFRQFHGRFCKRSSENTTSTNTTTIGCPNNINGTVCTTIYNNSANSSTSYSGSDLRDWFRHVFERLIIMSSCGGGGGGRTSTEEQGGGQLEIVLSNV